MTGFIDVPRLILWRVFPYTRRDTPLAASLATEDCSMLQSQTALTSPLCTGRASLEPFRIRQRERLTSFEVWRRPADVSKRQAQKSGRTSARLATTISLEQCIEGAGGPPFSGSVPSPGEVRAHFLEVSANLQVPPGPASVRRLEEWCYWAVYT
jgi:hypothetical protein